MNTFSSAQRFSRAPDFIATDMDGDLVMMSIERGAYFGLQGVGARVWELLEQPATVSELVAAIRSEYAVDAATCQADLERFLGELQAQGLLAQA